MIDETMIVPVRQSIAPNAREAKEYRVFGLISSTATAAASSSIADATPVQKPV
jgi:hypothetical protein